MSGPRSKLKVKTAIPMARIKKIMQSDEDVGKVSKHSPVLIVFARPADQVGGRHAREERQEYQPHAHQCVMATPAFDFLTDIVKDIPDIEPDKPKRTRKPRGEGKRGRKKGAEAADADAEDAEAEDDGEEEDADDGDE
ncbi:DR1associated protein 1 (negative cofactor 2 alpha), putative [Acanthamoeba castellanii str. Neff]|uniref:DR1associated protein 1 (Negative cofactor 2 alpha), putative n=1 Tax=Acanthamoeba castellanii (strain ATCC 30010 / Neff) TaxID=1257118 RepID=L8GT35_ACACF|nr:DR1associated protein 1 (negative cofactor 2 alpha), putative [Acanthamoeba castellanii str. Neff]ELR15773.1 DR1associated protein 1 (negative cofactor 2 alpha), putative [Acanthamoeba castellanii str. Neff]